MPVSTNTSNANRRAFRRGTSPQKKGSEASSAASTRFRRAAISTGSQTLFGTAEGSLGVIIGLDDYTSAFLFSLERSMVKAILPVGNFSHEMYRCCQAENKRYPAHGFLDGDLIESFLDLDHATMETVIAEMNRDGGWETDDISAPEDGRDKEEAVDPKLSLIHI